MKFNELCVGDYFKFNNEEYLKLPEKRVSCCKVQHNCKKTASGEKVALKPMDEVEKINNAN